MRRVFVDTSFLVALLDPRDDLFRAALHLDKRLAADKRSPLTTDAVVVEVANYFCRGAGRPRAIAFIGELRKKQHWTIVPVTPELQARAERRYARHTDKGWSLTDCISMEVMHDHRVKEAATADRHFAQAGFRVLLK